ncbi:chorismate mutase [Paremcibacter congregatus]|uniref:chorismate mutase n=1 Tax=Paremcibacter congregatus TaxID=2043170 RepID=UPI0030ECC54F|tara:strand:+ start:7551 stop:7898 length:348 start_codon:yes stop_codon:yes gene_type:complete
MSSHKIFTEKRKTIEYPARKCTTMAELRDEIDQLDRVIVELLSVRQGCMEQAAEIKQDRNLVRDEERVEDVVAKVLAHADKVGAHPELVEMLYRDMIEWCINYEMTVFDSARDCD